jgi:hypothetical protein
MNETAPTSSLDRRTLLALAAAGVTVPGASAAEPQTGYPEPGLAFAFQLDISLGPIQELGTVDGMRRRIIPITGGTFAGPRLRGEVLPGGADWQGVRPGDGLTRVSARYWIRASNGDVIGVQNDGIRKAPPAVMRRLMAGEDVAPGDYYFRTVPLFETGSAAHRWLNETMFVCVGARKPDRAIIRVYEIS